MKGFNCLLYINNEPLGAQINADLMRTTTTVDITNQIELNWQESLSHLKNWRVNCNGAYILNNTALQLLETAYNDSTPIDLVLRSPELSYQGKGIIISFPVGANYSDNLTYSIQILGTGPLTQICNA